MHCYRVGSAFREAWGKVLKAKARAERMGKGRVTGMQGVALFVPCTCLVM